MTTIALRKERCRLSSDRDPPKGRRKFHTTIDAADRNDESTEDMTAAATAPSPTAATRGGVICLSR